MTLHPLARLAALLSAGLLALFFLFGSAMAGTPDNAVPPALSPAAPPLAVARLSYAPLWQDLVNTRQAVGLGLSERDVAGEIPGLGVRTSSLRSTLAGLTAIEADHIWYCLAQQGPSLARQTAALGWEGNIRQLPSATGQADSLPSELGLTAGRQSVISRRPLPGDRYRLTVSRDPETQAELFGRDAGPGDWWYSLNRFLERDHFGVWVNPRPLLGMASLITGTDIRTILSSAGLQVPTSLQFEAFATDGDLGLALRADGIFPTERRDAGHTVYRVAERPDYLATVTLFPPAEVWSRLVAGREVAAAFTAANVSANHLRPLSVTVTLWRGEGDALTWSAVWLLADGADGRRHMERALSVIRSLADTRPDLVSVGAPEQTDKGIWWPVTYDGVNFQAGVITITADTEQIPLLIVTNAETGKAGVGPVQAEREELPRLVDWSIRLDSALRDTLLRTVLEFGEKYSLPWKMDAYDRAMPDMDDGWVERDSGGMEVTTTRGLLPFIVPLLDETLISRHSSAQERDDLLARRLRFLLEIAALYPYWQVATSGRGELEPLISWSLLPLNSEKGRRWLDGTTATFPGDYRSVATVLNLMVREGSLDGVRYVITGADQTWRLTAWTNEEPRLRVNARGDMERFTGNDWEPYRPDLLP